jgi:hypothetical protein
VPPLAIVGRSSYPSPFWRIRHLGYLKYNLHDLLLLILMRMKMKMKMKSHDIKRLGIEDHMTRHHLRQSKRGG